MTISGVSGAGSQAMPVGMGQTTDSTSRNIQSQITKYQKQLQDLTSDQEMSAEEKNKKRQEIQQEIHDLNNELRQHQLELRKQQQEAREAERKEASEREVEKETEEEEEGEEVQQGISADGMQVMTNAASVKENLQVQESVASKLEGRADVLGVEIDLDELRARNGLTANTEAKKQELADVELRAAKAASPQTKNMWQPNKIVIKDIRKTERQEKQEEEDKKKSVANNGSIHAPRIIRGDFSEIGFSGLELSQRN